jgi:hypothetical protein
MATKLEKTVKREIEIDGQPFMVAISPEGVKLTQKGFRKGREITWRALWGGGTGGVSEGTAAGERTTTGGGLGGTGSVGGGGVGTFGTGGMP